MLKAILPSLRNPLLPKYVLTFLLFLGVAIGLQVAGSAYKADFGGNSDEGGHYITGLMIRDYLATGHFASPLRFAENYYLFYPKVAIGHWPPVFYLVQGAWTLPFSPSRVSILLLMAVLTSLLAATLFHAIRSEFGMLAGIGAALLLISLPIIQTYTSMVMNESLVTLMMFLAALVFGRFLQKNRWQDSVLFGVVASVAILTKANAFSLALIPLISVVLLKRPRLLLQPSFWYPAIIVVMLCAPWYYKTRQMASNGFMEEWGTAYTLKAIPFFPGQLLKALGVAILITAMIGFVVKVITRSGDDKAHAKWIALGAMVLSVLIFQFAVPAALDHRYVIPAIPALICFSVAGIAWLAAHLPVNLSPKIKAASLCAVVLLVYGFEVFAIPRKVDHGFGQAAKAILSQSQFQKSVLLISSDSNGEGAFISEVARLEQRPGHIIVRAFKVLSKNRWADRDDNTVFQTPAEVMNYLDSIPIGILVMDTTPDAMHIKHHQQLMQMVKDFPDRWQLLATYPGRIQKDGPASEVLVYRLVGHENRPVNPLRIDMQYMLNRSFEGN